MPGFTWYYAAESHPTNVVINWQKTFAMLERDAEKGSIKMLYKESLPNIVTSNYPWFWLTDIQYLRIFAGLDRPFPQYTVVFKRQSRLCTLELNGYLAISLDEINLFMEEILLPAYQTIPYDSRRKFRQEIFDRLSICAETSIRDQEEFIRKNKAVLQMISEATAQDVEQTTFPVLRRALKR